MTVLLKGRKAVVTLLVVLVLAAGITTYAVARSHKKHARRKPTPELVSTIPVVTVDYATQVKPILELRCYRCHGPSKGEAGLRLDSPARIRKGSENGGVIIPGDGASSLLVTVLSGVEDRPAMPPSGDRLNAGEIALIKTWIDEGASAPLESSSEALTECSTEHTEKHWAFRQPISLPVPTDSGSDCSGNPIDAFLSVGRAQRGLLPQPPAPRALLLRRVYLDLIGLPPTRQELAAFLADTSEDAYEKVVDHLLASSSYGERWGRHWMDVWRYSDADGRKSMADIWWSSPHLWRWRDWIVRSLNEDQGYDQMVLRMLAGDEVAPEDTGALSATGFLVRNWFKLDRDVWLGNTVEHTAKAFLGLTIGCARCHDHKFDPISQKEYYQFRAFFEPHDVRTETIPGETGAMAQTTRVYDARPEEPTWLFVRGDARTPDKSARIMPGVPAALGGILSLSPQVAGSPSTGRRLALARWIGSPENPLTARVAVNHIWARHFGRPLVENVADFGMRTPPPVQQALLDWLAVDFMSHGWSMKHLHRLIVTSAAFRMQSSTRNVSAENLAVDFDNQFYWRANSRRMEAEVVRDSLLCLAGVLDRTAGGPPIDPTHGAATGRRSLYYRYSREDKMEFLTAFDAPGVEECYRREESIVPQQALALLNSAFSWDQARRIARLLEAESPSSASFVTAAFEHVLGRPPEAQEIAACVAFLARQESLLADPCRLTLLPTSPPPVPIDTGKVSKVPGLPLVLSEAKPLPSVAAAAGVAQQAREYLIHALFNHNDFITIR